MKGPASVAVRELAPRAKWVRSVVTRSLTNAARQVRRLRSQITGRIAAFTYASGREIRDADPTLELRVPISPNDSNMRMLHFLLESIQAHGGPIGRAAHCVASVGSHEPERDLAAEYPWTAHYSVEFRWVDDEHFEKWRYDATGYDRFWVTSNADVVAMIDADLLFTGDFDDVIRAAHREQMMFGFMAHVSPFAFRETSSTSSAEWWRRVYDEAGLECPPLTFPYSGFGLDWATIYPELSIDTTEFHRFGPAYFNYGFIVGPRDLFDKMGETFVEDLDAAARVSNRGYESQIANCIGFERHNIQCDTIPMKYNFPLNLCRGGATQAEAIRRINPDPDGEDDDRQIRIFHYINGRPIFETEETVEEMLARTDLEGPWLTFQQRLRDVKARIDHRKAQ